MPTPNDAMAYAKRFVGNMPIDDSTIKFRILDDAHVKLWMAANWSWTLGALEVVSLTNDTQEVNLAGAYTDFLGLVHASYVGSGGQETKGDIAISAILPVTTIITGRPTQIMYVPGTPNKVRFLPVPTGYATLPVSQVPKVLAIYKKKRTEIVTGNAGNSYLTTSGVPDEWFWVYQEIVLLKAYQFTHDPRLGNVQTGPNGVAYTGQFAVVEAALAAMRANEEPLLDSLGKEING